MDEERKSSVPEMSAGQEPTLAFPAANASDPEDVSWALSTAEAMWKRGEQIEALKWLRKAVEAASDSEADARYLELAKAAAELSSSVGARESQLSVPNYVRAANGQGSSAAPIQTPSGPPRPGSLASVPNASLDHTPKAPPAVLAASLETTKKPVAQPTTTSNSASTSPSTSTDAEAEGTKEPGSAEYPDEISVDLDGAGTASAPVATPAVPLVQGPALDEDGMKTPFLPPPAKIQQTVQIARQAVPSDLTQQPTLNSMAVSLPLSDEGDDPVTLPPQPKGEDIPEEEPTRRSHADVSSSTFKALSAAEIDEWPTRSVHDAAELAALASQSAPSQSDFKAAPPRSPAPSASAIPTASSSPAPSPSQSPAADQAEFKEPRLTHAVRVVVWRDADGVHVAPHGTPVRAFTVDAMLVALEEDEDLAGLLGKRRR